MYWTTGTLASQLNFSKETIRAWSEEFSRHLSATATPGEGKHRHFSDDDLPVFVLIARMKRAGRTYAEIHEALDAGQRGEVNPSALVFGTESREIAVLQAQIDDLQGQLETITRERDEARTASAVDRALREQSDQRAAALEREVRTLIEQIGSLKARIDDD